MKNKLQKAINKINTVMQYPELISTTFNKVNRGFCKDLLFLKNDLDLNFSTIIDVGAAVGEYSKAASFIFPQAHIYAFEPIPDSFRKLENLSKKIKNIQCFNVALSDSVDVSEFHLNEFSFSSSLLNMTKTHKKIFPFTNNETVIKVRTNKLDNVLEDLDLRKPILLKLDVQGAELNVLKGATESLNSIDVIQLEVNFMNFYEGQASIEDIISFLKSFGFSAFLQINPVFSNKTLLYSDFIFFRNNNEL